MITKNFLTFDIEEWFHANYDGINLTNYDSKSTNLESNVDRLIDICNIYDIKATCFVLGDIAQQKPKIIQKLYNSGHEIASHGMSHRLIHSMTPAEFHIDLKRSSDVLENLTGQKVVGFRAPSWSVKSEIFSWFYETLSHEGFSYSSSVYPANNPLFGIPNFTDSPTYPTSFPVLEIPQSILNLFGTRVGYAGGGFLRFFPTWLIKQAIKHKNQNGKNVFIYLHPREIDMEQPRLKLGLVDGYFHYQGISGCETKMHALLNQFSSSFMRMDEYVKNVSVGEILV
jgi:polysaccharide deacetylase family protein (PEP-CTERM system associated)